MKNKMIYLSVAMAFALFTSCKKDVQSSNADSAQTEEHQGKELGSEFDAEIDKLVSQLTLEEKIGMLHGNSMFSTGAVERLGIPELKMADGPLGVREEISRDNWAPAGLKDDFATYYPAGGGLAATWNTEMAYTFGNSVGQELRARDKDMLLSPAINIVRTPLGGRTYEYMSEDPFLNKKIAVPLIVGLQDNDVMACVKHFAANNQETNRDFVDVQIDERTLREIYLPAFEASIKEAHAYSVMGAYNKFRGEYLCENDYMLNKILRDEWGFKGVVVSDWAAVHSTVKSLNSGLDIEMGTPKPFNEFFLADKLIAAAKAGEISEAEIDVHVKRILRVLFQVKAMGGKDRVKGSISTEAHYQDAYKIAAEAIVLLKNDNNALPLKLDGVKSIAVIGNNAMKKNALGGFGAGVKTKREVTPLEGLKNRLPSSIKINYAEGYLERYDEKNKGKLGDITLNGPVTIDQLDPAKFQEAIEAAKKSDVAIIFAGSNRDYETEASDRRNLKLPFGQEELIKKVLEVNPRTIVVMIAGAPFDINEVSKKSSALVWSWFNGSEGGNALADVLLGKVNPSGKLPWTMPKNIMDSPAHATNSFPGGKTVQYAEGILVGYRWFDTKNVTPLYPFGYGLSYTTFAFDNAKADKDSYNANETITVSVDVKNTGKVDGKEVVQLYASKSDSKVTRAAKELKGFKKVEVKSGGSNTVTIKIPAKELAYYDVASKKWVVESGKYTLKIGNSSRDIKKEIVVTIK
ncbi:glycoside hydrolase family 3 C-terminal domain-containing protein [Flavobacterium sp. JLP]|uniref:glycoside hydrolase family 3 C-terminal domain-containing protein n=1 Tax=unclassified Flavobacterium TaxID=196869 RepID=UPI00188C97F7|nr:MULTISPECIES: glycoside hydrolase family 3 C-terminal domain-containing protein [unclassified Flavobacterium]MBF4493638.1 glycoside hydrolase family 3 C-terminal domain-containing protein [Flavobacterium sp. MR2016-29]MBF4508152.1 glycoside hydrolase family 3 C-terminal domain-containing protein [Flavobacterium sp. JLP]